MRKMGGNEG